MHLLAAISYHGFGHLAQTASVLNELVRRRPSLKVTIQSAAPRAVLSKHIHHAFEHVHETTDVGMVNRDALEVLVPESAAAYAEFHRDWETKVERQARQLRALQADVILADIPYLLLSAAARAKIPAVALCSLNWADIYRHYLGERAEAPAILAQMLEGYRAAQVFLRPQPSMPMRDLSNTRPVGPIARRGTHRRTQLNQQLQLTGDEKLVLVALGGIQGAISLAQWPRLSGVRWLVQADWDVGHPDALYWDRLGMNFIDVLCSSDALITKPGYGSFAETVCNGIRALYVPRADWPESEVLVAWLKQHVPCAAITRRQFEQGEFFGALEHVLRAPAPSALPPAGVAQAADEVEKYFPR